MKTLIYALLFSLIALPACMTAEQRAYQAYQEAHQYDWMDDMTPAQVESLLQAMRHQQIMQEMQWQSLQQMVPIAPAPVYLWGR